VKKLRRRWKETKAAVVHEPGAIKQVIGELLTDR